MAGEEEKVILVVKVQGAKSPLYNLGQRRVHVYRLRYSVSLEP